VNTTNPLNGAYRPADRRTDVPHPARMYDYYLGGKDHYEVDREAAEEVVRRVPEAIDSARANRAWVMRAVRHLAEMGVRQFLDVGTGLPTEPNLHQVVQSVAADARVLYVDNDPIVLTHAQTLLVSNKPGQVQYGHGDLRDPQAIIETARSLDIFDWEQPIALVLSAIAHFIADKEDVAGIITMLRDSLPPNSLLALSHATGDFQHDRAARGAAVYEEYQATVRVTMRSHEQVEALFAGTLIEPGWCRYHFGIPTSRLMQRNSLGYGCTAVSARRSPPVGPRSLALRPALSGGTAPGPVETLVKPSRLCPGSRIV
jgi:hypothetical protein